MATIGHIWCNVFCLNTPLIEIFSQNLPAEQILTGEADLAFYGTDSSFELKGAASIVLQPKTYEQVQEIVRACRTHKLHIIPSGGRTGYNGGACASNHEVVVSFDRMNAILEVDPVGMTLTAQAGATTEAIQAAAKSIGLFYGVDFASKGSSQIGGNIATNAGGVRVIRYGCTREWVLGLKVVTGTGELLELNGKLIKNQTGYDFRHLVIGSEGTLGLIVEATLKLAPAPKPSRRFLIGAETIAQALSLLSEIRLLGDQPTLFEYFDERCLTFVLEHASVRDPFLKRYAGYVLLEVEERNASEQVVLEEFLLAQMEKGNLSDVCVPESAAQTEALLTIRELIPQMIREHATAHKQDLSLPVSKIGKFIEQFRTMLPEWLVSTNLLVFGHLGDGNLHVNILKDESMDEKTFFGKCHEFDAKIFALIKHYNGSISAEHGIGLLKKTALPFSRSRTEIGWMREIKRVFDPESILNPGKIFSLKAGEG